MVSHYIISNISDSTDWIRPEKEIEKSAQSKSVLKKGLFLNRYKLPPSAEISIDEFRSNSKQTDIEVNATDRNLNYLPVIIRFTHDYNSHCKKTMEEQKAGDSSFLRSSTISTNEHIFVTKA